MGYGTPIKKGGAWARVWYTKNGNANGYAQVAGSEDESPVRFVFRAWGAWRCSLCSVGLAHSSLVHEAHVREYIG